MKITLCIDRQSRNTPSPDLREYLIDIECPLRSIDDVFDELKIVTDDNKKLVGTIIRRCEVDKYGVLKKLEKEKVQELVLPEITLFEGENYVYIKEYTNLSMKIEYLTNAEMNKYFATKMELNSTIQQTMDSILLEVSRKADSKGVSAAIKMLTDEINLKVQSDKIIASLNAAIKDGKGIISILGNYLVIDTDNFKLDNNGHMTATSANFINGDISTDKNITIGDNLYVGQNQSTTADFQKYIYFSTNAYIRRWIFPSGGNYLCMYSDLNTRLSCQDTGYINVMNDSIGMSHSPDTSSDKRLKNKIKSVDTSWINELKVKEFEYKKTPNRKMIGLIAQDYLNKDYSKYFLNENKDGYYSINYGNITNALIQYCQKLEKRISDLERRCNHE